MPIIKSVLFDLDGTLIDTATDLGQALNSMRKARDLPPLPQAQIRPEAGRGCKGLLKLGLNIDSSDANYKNLCDELLNFYQLHLLETTQLFPGMEKVLTHLEQNNIPWGIVTNKPHRFTTLIVDNLNLTKRAACIISGDSLKNSKPHPEPLLHACQLLHHSPAHCLYVGDSAVDIIASKAAGMPALAALYGYIPADENPETWQAEGYINHPLEIIPWLDT
jgi:2-phosphoglycolate phosphatase